MTSVPSDFQLGLKATSHFRNSGLFFCVADYPFAERQNYHFCASRLSLAARQLSFTESNSPFCEAKLLTSPQETNHLTARSLMTFAPANYPSPKVTFTFDEVKLSPAAGTAHFSAGD
jgi:hypothetical protein